MVVKGAKPSKFTRIDSAIREKSFYKNKGLEDVVGDSYFEHYPWTGIAMYVTRLTDIPVSSTTLRRWAKAGGWELRRDN